MSEQIKEAVSALLDDSATELDVRRVLKQSQQSESVSATLKRYQLMSSVLQQGDSADTSRSLLSVDLTEQIASAIENEEFEAVGSETWAPVASEEPASLPPANAAVAVNDEPSSGWLRQIGGLAVAASVAAVVVVTSQVLDQSPTDSSAAELAAASTESESRRVLQRSSILPPQRVSDGAEAQLAASEIQAQREIMMQQVQGYMQVHARHASMNGTQGALPLARFADFKR